MRIKNYYDKIGLGSIGLGIDGLFIHSDLTSWMNNLSPYFVFIILKIALIILGIYLLKIYNSSKSIEKNSLDTSDQLQKRILLTKKVGQYHWYFMIVLCFLSISINWGKAEAVAPVGIAFIIFVLWLLLVWPIIHFWKKSYANPINVVDLNNLTNRQELIKFLFIQGNKQYKKILKISLIFCLIGPIICAFFPSLAGQTEGSDGYGICLLMCLFFTFVIWIVSLFFKRKIKKIKNYYLSNPDCKIWASEDSEYSLHIKFDEKELEVGKLFLPFSSEDCIQIINNDNYQKQTQVENEKEEIKPQISSNTKYDDVNDLTIMNEISGKYESRKTFNLPRLILLFILFLPLGFVFSFLYAYLMWYISFPYFKIIIAAVFGAILGFILPIKLSKCTNSKVAILSAVIFAFICHYFGWVTWMDLLLNLRKDGIIEITHPKSPISSIALSSSSIDQIIFLFTNPSAFLNVMLSITKNFYYEMFSFKAKGFSLYLIWFVEMAIVLFFSAFASYERSNKPFSVKKNKWLESFEIQLSYICHLESLKNAINNSDNAYFENLAVAEKEESYSELEILHLGDEQAYLSIKNHKKRIDEKGKIKYDKQELTKYAKIDNKILEALMHKSSHNSVQAP
jgi:hypothetical protein